MRETLEREIKLAPGEGFVLPELGGERLPTRVFVSTYHDTPDLRLAQHGVTLRHRVEDGAGLWQLKLPAGSARLELELNGTPAKPPAEMLVLLPAYLRGRELVPVARLRTRREGVRAQGAEIVDDNVSVLEGQRVARRFREVEVELLEGDERTLRRLEKELRRAGAESAGELRPKLYRALGLAGPVEAVEIAPGTSPLEAIGLAFEQQYRALLTHDPGARRGDDAEELHQLRVATRRLRAYLRAARPLLNASWAESLRAELGWLGSVLGPARDLDVLLEHLRVEVAELEAHDAPYLRGLLDTLESERRAAYADVVAALESDRYMTLLDRLEAAAAPPLSGTEVPLAKLWHREAKKMRRAFTALGDDPEDAELHAARIHVKRARYAADLAAHELGAHGAAFIGAAKKMQDVLGDHQDSVVAEERVRRWLETTPGSAFAAGRLVQLERDRRAAARAAWPRAWQRLDRAARKAAG
jgi:CHAD domain-containing protein